MPESIQQALKQASEKMPSDTAVLDAELLLCHVLDVKRAYLRTWPERELNEDEEKFFRALVSRRATGEPLAYITGTQEFWSLSLKVTSDTLIPRPETELLVEHSLDLLSNVRSPVILDLGTGSGAIALALAIERPDAMIVATDKSAAALDIAKFNALKHHLANVHFVRASWGVCFADHQFDLVVSNPPYVDKNDPDLASDVQRYEPGVALFSQAAGLQDIDAITTQSKNLLKDESWLLLEHGWKQAENVRALLMQKGLTDVQTVKDLAGHDRVSMARR
ncbi:MAG: peptide chain release factor N(5)-glutamine methyltransferase [Gammaproteobacteria bacterium]|nr:peptide chain release factor N(5)-glutamine methyltransferase [Gammaproteobacteria bacterium]